MISIGIIGCSGRMGKSLIEAVMLQDDCELSGGLVKAGSDVAGMDIGTIAGIDNVGINASSDPRDLIEKSDVIIDFSNPDVSMEIAQLCADHGVINVIGTTGFSDEQMSILHEHAKKTPLLWSSNMSLGVTILSALTQKVAALLDDDFDIEIVEMHHCRKVDAPSGTALSLGRAAAAGRGVAFESVACTSREGITGARPSGEIGFATLRGGDVVGDHTVIFAGSGERIELTHKASDRKIFARGAVRAALWLQAKTPGFYTIKDMVL